MINQTKVFKHKLRRLLTDQRLFRLVVVEQEEGTHIGQRCHQKKLQESIEKKASQA